MIIAQQQAQILDSLGILNLNPMQQAAQKAIVQDNDTFLIAPTGSGKTHWLFIACFPAAKTRS